MARKRSVEQPFWVDNVGVQDKRGHEVPDPNPVAIPAGFSRPETLAEQVRRLVRTQRVEDDTEIETWDEANDFLVDDDFDPSTPWETIYDEKLGREVTPEEFQKNWANIRDEMARKLRNHYRLIEQAEQEEQLLTGKNNQREAAEGAAPSSKGPKAPPAEQNQ